MTLQLIINCPTNHFFLTLTLITSLNVGSCQRNKFYC